MGGYLTEAFPTNFHTFHRQRPLVGDQTPDDFKEVTEAEKAKIEAQDALWVRPPQSFIDMWNALYRGCDYNPKTGYLVIDYGNGFKIDNLTYEDALLISKYGTYAEFSTIINGNSADKKQVPQIRATIPCARSANNLNFPVIGWGIDSLEYIKIYMSGGFAAAGSLNIISSPKLKHILDEIDVSSIKPYNVTSSLVNPANVVLETIYLKKINGNINAAEAPKLSLESFQFWIDNAVNTAPITITVHPDVFSKLNDPENSEWYELNQNAQERQIAFATT